MTNDLDLSLDLDDAFMSEVSEGENKQSSRVRAFWRDLTLKNRIFLIGGTILLILSIIIAAVFGTFTVTAQKDFTRDYTTAVTSVNRVNQLNMDIGDIVSSDTFYKEMVRAKKKNAKNKNVSAYATRMINAHKILKKSGRYWPLTLDMTDADALTNTVVYFAITDETRNIASAGKDATALKKYSTFTKLLDLSHVYYKDVLAMMEATQQVAENNTSWKTGLVGVNTYPVFVISKDAK